MLQSHVCRVILSTGLCVGTVTGESVSDILMKIRHYLLLSHRQLRGIAVTKVSRCRRRDRYGQQDL